jgi:hypothetical protein
MARDLDPRADYEGPPGNLLLSAVRTILLDGPDAGVHTIATVNALSGLERRLDRGADREFAARIGFRMSAEESMEVFDTTAGARLDDGVGLLYLEDRGRLTKFLPYGFPPRDVFRHVAARRRN